MRSAKQARELEREAVAAVHTCMPTKDETNDRQTRHGSNGRTNEGTDEQTNKERKDGRRKEGTNDPATILRALALPFALCRSPALDPNRVGYRAGSARFRVRTWRQVIRI